MRIASAYYLRFSARFDSAVHNMEDRPRLPVAIHSGPYLRIADPDEALYVFDLGAFGKGILQRSRPLTIGIEKVHRRRKARNFVMAPDAPIIHSSVLQLNLEEGFYLAFELYAIQIQSDAKILSCSEAMEKFCIMNRYFKYYYVAYRHFRRMGWVLKSGIKYGVDFVMYPNAAMFVAAGRNHVHAPYSVTIRYPSESANLQFDEVDDRAWKPDMSWFTLQSASRLACQVWPPHHDHGRGQSLAPLSKSAIAKFWRTRTHSAPVPRTPGARTPPRQVAKQFVIAYVADGPPDGGPPSSLPTRPEQHGEPTRPPFLLRPQARGTGGTRCCVHSHKSKTKSLEATRPKLHKLPVARTPPPPPPPSTPCPHTAPPLPCGRRV